MGSASQEKAATFQRRTQTGVLFVIYQIHKSQKSIKGSDVFTKKISKSVDR